MKIALFLGMVAAGAGAGPQETPPPAAAGVEFFEKRIRPILVEKCYPCHSRDVARPKGGLLLDSRGGLLRGGQQGPAVVPGQPDRSLLIKAIRCAEEGDLEMPPKEADRLTPDQIADFVAWVGMGAPDPRAEVDASKTRPQVAARPLWSVEKPKPVEVPPVKDPAWTRTPVDRFVLSKLEEKGLRPAPPADKRTFLRRVTFDLTGLPPTPEEMEAFLADDSPESHEKVLDRLLASPRYGERWGRFWLDVARYADTAGAGDERFPYAHTYRDWVIRAFNEDLPFDDFVVQQIAADRLSLGAEDNRALAALGFLTVGRRFATVHDVIDDQIDVVTRGFLGFTVSCARCHDHKYDPIPTADYYSLYAIFAASTRPREFPLLAPLVRTSEMQAYDDELRKGREGVDALVRKAHEGVMARLLKPEKVAAYLLALKELKDLPAPRASSEAFGRDLHPSLLDRWKALLSKRAGKTDSVFGLWHACAALAAQELQEQAPALAVEFLGADDGDPLVHPLLVEAFAGRVPTSIAEVAGRYGAFLASLALEQRSSDPELEKLRQALRAPAGPLNVEPRDVERHATRQERSALTDLRKKVDTLATTHPGAPPRAMSLEDVPKPAKGQRIFKRGNPTSPGDEVPRRFLACLSGPDRPVYASGSGRLELARAIADPANPVATRVWINRVWTWHFGQGLVRTPSEFGTRGEPPTHPELLDWLARWFRSEGGSTKKLHRLILSSSVYRQSVAGDPRGRKVDPENRLLGQAEPRRLDFEALRDALLAVSGDVGSTAGGRPADLWTSPFPRRRTVYGLVDRQNLPEVFRAFDFADPDLSTAQRDETTVPQQALFLMNSPFVADCARRLSRRPDVLAEPDVERRVGRLFRILFGREVRKEEWAAFGDILARPDAWERFVHALLLTNEFVFVE